MAKKYWWEEDKEQKANQSGSKYWWDDGTIAATISKNVVGRVNQFLTQHDAYIADYQKRYAGRKGGYEDAYVSDSAEWLGKVKAQKDRFDSDYDSILSYMDQYKDYLDEGFVLNVKSNLLKAKSDQNKVLNNSAKDNMYWKEWESEDLVKEYGSGENAYKAHQLIDANAGKTTSELDGIIAGLDGNERQWLTDYRAAVEYDELSKYDLSAGNQEIEQLRSERDKYGDIYNLYNQYNQGLLHVRNDIADPADGGYLVKTSTGDTFITQNAAERLTADYNAFYNKYGDYTAFSDSVAQKEQYWGRASRLQEGIRLSSVSVNEDFADYSGYVSTEKDNFFGRMGTKYNLGYGDLTYEYINGDEDLKKRISSTMKHEAGLLVPIIKDIKVFDQMSNEEIGIYNYYYAKEGKEAAEKYLNNIQESLNAREATERFSKLEDKTLLELAFGVEAGIDQFASGIKNLFNFKDDYIPQSSTQMVSGMVREDLADVGPNLPEWLGGGSLGQMGYDAITTTANMAPSVLTSMAVGMINPVAGQVVGNTIMGASASGNAYQEALNLGYNKGQARAYSTLVGASEAGLQYLIGGIGQLGGKWSSSAVTKMLNGVDNAIFRVAGKIAGNMVSEGFEEGLQEILTPWFKNLTLHTDENINWSEVAYSSLLGALTAGFMDGPTTIAEGVKTYKTGKKLQARDISAQRLAEIGKTFSADTVAYQLAGRVNENTGAYTLGRLFNEIGATLTEQNISEITEALVAKGMSESVARKNAEVLAYVVEGGQMSDGMIAVIEANDVLAEVARTTLVDANTTLNQRTQGYNEMLKALAEEVASPKNAKANQAQQTQENAPSTDTVDGQTGIATESHAEADTVDTSPAKVMSIADIGKKTIKLEDGSEVNVKDADLSPDDGVRIETIASIDGISTEDANFVLNTLRANTGASAQMDSLGAKEAYKYGFYGFSQDHIAKHGVFANSLTETQRQAIYEVGQKARQKQIESSSPKATTKERGIYFDQGGDKVVSFKDMDKSLLSEKKRTAGVQAAIILNKLGIGGDVYFFESYIKDGKRVYKDRNGIEKKAPNGWYSETDGSIHIDLNAGVKGDGLVLFTLAHELTHFIEKWSPQKYKILADFLIENYEKGQSMDKLVRAKQALLQANRGKPVSYNEAYSEVIADSMEAMLADGNVMEKILELKAKDEGLVAKIKQFFDNLLVKIRNTYKGLTPDTNEGKAVQAMTDSIERIQQLFAEALVEASENFQSAEVQKNTTEDGGEVQHSLREFEDGTRFVDVQMDSNIFDGMTVAEMNKAAKNILMERFARKVIGLDNRAFVNGDSINEYLHPSKSIDIDTRKAKLTAAGELDNLLDAGTALPNKADGEDGHIHPDAIDFSYYKTIFKVGNEYFEGIVNIKNIQRGKLLKDVTKIKNITKDIVSSYGENPKSNFLRDASMYSIRNDDEKVKSESAEEVGLEVDEKTESVSPKVMYSERTWTESDYVQERDKAAKEIAKAIGVSEKKAKAYIDSVNSIAKMIAEDRVRLDYFSSPGRSSFVSNVEYGGSFDFSTLCKKRRLLTGTFTAIQKALPNTALTANEILKIRNLMKEKGLEVSCGLCYVEGSRANMGQFAKEFLKLYKQYYPDAWQPNMADVNTPDGIEWVRINHPEAYEQYEYFWNHYGTLKEGDKNLFARQQKPKLYQLHTEYKGEILEKFNNDDNVEEKNLNGGIRLQSFSDFEIVHLIDTMQIIMDMARVGLAGQAYTKVPDFAWALGDTGLKINLSLIAKGVDENGKLIFDDVEGMPIAEAMKLRDRYSKNVGTILVAFNDEQLLAAMADDRVDFIIPFHRSQWKKSQYGAMGLPAKTKDYTYMQNEKFIKPQYHEYRGRMVQDKATNYMPNEYWDFSKSGKENAEAYLEMCARNNKRPKFYKLLQNNGDGSYSLKADGSTDGYWKLLIDFKMYDNDGNGSPQMPVKPDFNMDEAQRMLNDYQGGHSNFPVAQGVVDEFVQEYKDSHKGALYSDRDFGDVVDSAVKQFGTTTDFAEAGFILPSGEMLKFTDDKQRGKRQFDHRAIGMVYGVSVDLNVNHGFNKESSKFLDEFVENGGIRFDAGEPSLNMDIGLQLSSTTPLTKAQEQIIRDLVSWKVERENLFKSHMTEEDFLYTGPLAIRIDFGGNSNYAVGAVSEKDLSAWGKKSLEYKGGNINADRIIADIRHYYQTGETRQLSAVAQFRYQDRADESVSNRSLLANAFEGLAQTDIEKNKIQEYKSKIDLINAEEKKLSELNAKIKELSFSKGPRDTKKIRDLQVEARQTANRINTLDKVLLRLEASKPLQDVLDREKKKAYQKAEQRGKEALDAYKERAAKAQRELLERWQESRKKGIESREKAYVREKIKNFKKRLETMLLRPTDKQYIPIDLIKAMVDVCSIIDTDTDLYKADGSINKAQERRNLTKEKLQNLKDEYEKLKTNSDPIYAGEFDEMVYAYLTQLRDNYAGKHLKDMSLDELTDMYEVLRAIDETLRDARKLIGWGDAETVYDAGDSIVAEQRAITESRKNGKRNAAQKATDTIDNLSLSPVRNVERMSGYNQDSALLKLFKKFEQGIRKKNKFVMEAYKSFEHLTSGKEYDDAIYTEVGGKKYTDVNGREFGLSKMQMMQAILSFEREQANKNLHHIENGGFTFADLDLLRKGKLKEAISAEYSHRVPAAITMIAEFQEILKDDKWCQDYMAVARKFFNETAKDAINETTIILKHRIIAKDKSYIPFEVDKNFVTMEISAEHNIQQTISAYGVLKDTKDNAPQALIITGLNNVIERHIEMVGTVYGLAVEVRNYNKVWNVRSLDEAGNNPTVKEVIERNWGKKGVEHITQTVQDIQGPRVRERSAMYDKVKSGYIGATFLLNLSVVTKQVGSLFSSISMLRWRNPVRMIGNLFYTMANHKKISAEVDKYTATAWMRRQGLSDAELHTLMTEGKKTLIGRLIRKLPSIINPTKWITAMDHAVALSLWRYAKIDTAKRTGLTGEELLKATAEFYDEVVENTQSMTDVLHRPEIQKRGDVISEAVSMFKTDLYQMAGQLQATTGRYMANKTKENGKALGRTVYSIVMSAVWGQLMTTVFALLRYKVNQYRDDEDEELTAESWLKRQGFALGGDLMGYILPIFGSEVVGFIENIIYGESEDIVDSLALTAINDLYNNMISIGSSIKDGKMPEPAVMKKLVVKALQVFGLPANNVLRTIEAIHLHAKDIANGKFFSFEAGVNRSPKHHIHRIIEAVDDGNLDVAKGLFETALEEQATEAADGGEYGDDELKEAKSSLKSALGTKYKDGEVTYDIARKVLSEVFDLDDDDIYWAFDKWDYAKENGSSDDYTKYNDFYEAVRTGKNLKAVIQKYTDNGVEKKDLASQITSYFKPLYKEMSKTERAGIKGYLLNAYQLLGYNRYEKSKDIDNWLKD